VLVLASSLILLLIVTTSPIGSLCNKITENAFAASSQSTNNNSSQFLTYTNDTYGINILYPASWNSSPGEGNNKTGDSSTDIVSFSPKDTNSSATFDVSVDNVDSGENLKQFVSDSISDDKTDLQNFKVNESSSSGNSLAGNPAYKMLYSYIDNGENIKGLETGTIIGNKAYFIQYENSPEQFDSDLPLVQKMIDSLKITTPKIHG
jgi:hypothetical protein